MIVQSFCAEDTYEIGKKIGQEAQPGQVKIGRAHV